ncbi:MAG TPA: type II secretion system protein, partial [Candidatus Saccharimonadales bacterium]|nr:type II secretion system protein [Candidatus Saccharimonadales bacterium]
MKKLKSQKGFGAIEILLVLVILGMIGGIGYYVYKANQSEPKVSDFSIPKQKQKTEVQDETSAWLEVESLNKEFSLRIPDGW